MKEFKKVEQVFIKSNNTTNKIFNRYLYSLIPFILMIILYNIIDNNVLAIVNLIKSLALSIIICFVIYYIFKLIKKEKFSLYNFLEDNILTISVILGLFSVNSSILTIVLSCTITLFIKKLYKDINFASSLYGILIILISNHYIGNIDTPLINLERLSYSGNFDSIVGLYGNIMDYVALGKYYLSPLLSIIVFIYLFYKKSIKYNIVLSYIFTFSFVMFIIGIFNNMNIWYLLFQLCTGNILFLSVFCLTDYPFTPISGEGQIIYGMILGLITCILRFIIPELSTVIAMILGPILFTKFINKISYKLKYDKKFYYMMILINLILIIITTTIITIII